MKEFLPLLWDDDPDCYGEFRYMQGSKVYQEWGRIPGPYDSRDTTETWDVYFGVLPRLRMRGRAEDCVTETHVLWVDVDAKNTGGKGPALQGLAGLLTVPSIIVDSGHGYHGYWLLRDKVPILRAQTAMRGLAREVRGDSVWDAPRIMRLPGTQNHKDDPPLPVRVVFFDLTKRYRLTDFDQYIKDAGRYGPASELPYPRDVYPNRGPSSNDLPDWLSDLIVNGPPSGSDRSAECFKVALWLTRYGWSIEDIEGVFASHPEGIGEKYWEKGLDAPRWAKLTIHAARDQA